MIIMNIPKFDLFTSMKNKLIMKSCKTCDDLHNKLIKVHNTYDNRVKSIPFIKDNIAKESVINNLNTIIRPRFENLQNLYRNECKQNCKLIEPLQALPIRKKAFTLAFGDKKPWYCKFRKNDCDNLKTIKDALCCDL